MKLAILECLRCPRCHGGLSLVGERWRSPAHEEQDAGPSCADQDGGMAHGVHARACRACVGFDLTSGMLTCLACGTTYPVRQGVARMDGEAVWDTGREPLTARTARTFGYLWRQHPVRPGRLEAEHHFKRLAHALQLPGPRGLVLDAGCGNGGDLVHLAQCDGVEAVGLELSDAGCAAAFAQIAHLQTAHVVQGNLLRLPLADGVFDLAYAYGVLHHLPDAEAGLRELIRVTRSGGRVAVYLYEDFLERARVWRWLLGIARWLRWVTARLPRPMLYGLCLAGAPAAFALFTLPSRALRTWSRTRAVAETMPFHHATSALSLAPELYDRFAAPIERRFTRQAALAFCRNEGLHDVTVVNARGWMATGTKPL